MRRKVVDHHLPTTIILKIPVNIYIESYTHFDKCFGGIQMVSKSGENILKI